MNSIPPSAGKRTKGAAFPSKSSVNVDSSGGERSGECETGVAKTISIKIVGGNEGLAPNDGMEPERSIQLDEALGGKTAVGTRMLVSGRKGQRESKIPV